MDVVLDDSEIIVPSGGMIVESHMPGSVWKIECTVGDIIEEGETLAVIEAMKIEIPILAPAKMKVDSILIDKAQTVKTGQALFTLAPAV